MKRSGYNNGNRNRIHTLFDLSRKHRANGQLTKAIEVLDKAVEIDEGHVESPAVKTSIMTRLSRFWKNLFGKNIS